MGFGRLDQYLYPFYAQDRAASRLTRDEAAGLLAEFFISLNKDSDLYSVVQQGDNGQSLMLGGMKPDGSSGVNDLTYLAMEVSCELRLIDPKINLRVDSHTPEDLLELAARLTEAGLGFPQYSNDEVVIPALVSKGYSLEDAREYTVAACWEFIIPARGADIVNLGAVSFPAAVDRALRKTVGKNAFDMDVLHREICADIKEQVANVIAQRPRAFTPSPLASVLFDGALESGRDIAESARYNNLGLHGAGSAEGADALAAIAWLQTHEPEQLTRLPQILDENFANDEELRQRLRNEPPKVGNGDAAVDKGLTFLFDAFADACEAVEQSGVIGDARLRPGTGSAQFYVYLSQGEQWPWMVELFLRTRA